MRIVQIYPVMAGLLVLGCSDGREGGDMFGTGSGASAGDASSGPGSADGGTDGASGGSADGGDSTDDGAEGGVRYDVGEGNTGGGDDPGDCDCGNLDWSYIWIANSGQGTVSKINTRTLEEEGRYQTRPDGAGNPSRTSVSIDGRAVAVANRHAGIVKIWARTTDCDPNANGTPGLQTSSGKGDVLAWGQDDCIAWYLPFSEYSVQRPVQWTSGTLNAAGCKYVDQKIWTVTGKDGKSPGTCGPNGVWVHRIDGDGGTIDDTIHIPENEFKCDIWADNGVGLGAYGGAADADGNFWFHSFNNPQFVRVDFQTKDYEIFEHNGYGITVDTKSRVWFGSLSRFDYDTKQWAHAGGLGDNGGVAQDLDGRMWASAGNDGVTYADMETLARGPIISLPGSSIVKGVTVDIDGFVWAIRQGDTKAYKIDPDTHDYEFYDGLDNPYSYSDMAGGAITNVTCHPPEG